MDASPDRYPMQSDVSPSQPHLMRPLIQYDLDGPPMPPTAPTHSLGRHAPPYYTRRPPPTKKRKRHHHNPQRSQLAAARETPLQHWDDPGSAPVGVVYEEQEGSTTTLAPVAVGPNTVSYADDVEEEYDEEPAVEGDDAIDIDVEQGEEEEESEPHTHEEIWDDAALIDAWNSAEAEYEAYHGTSKAWKTEPVKKSPLWYNELYIAPTQPGCSKSKAHSKAPPQGDGEREPDTALLDFDTFVPTHDPSLAVPSNIGANSTMTAPFSAPPSSTTMVSRDEAFNNALSAMYWCGYWTAVYHSQSNGQGNNITAGTAEENRIEADEDEDEDEEDLVPAQR